MIPKLPKNKFLVDGLYFIASEDRVSVLVTYGKGRYNFSEIVIPKSVRYAGYDFCVTGIDKDAFSRNESLCHVVIPDTIITIGLWAFMGCTSLTHVEVPSSVNYIRRGAFAECHALSSIIIPESVIDIDSSAFNLCSSLVSLNLAPENPNYDFDNGVLFNKSKTRLIQCLCTKRGKYIIPSSVESIDPWAFYGCSKITSLTIPYHLTNIGKCAFCGCTSLTSIVWNAKKINALPSSSDHPFYYIRHGIESFTFGEYVEEIPQNLCNDMHSLNKIIIPSNVNRIGPSAFERCYVTKENFINFSFLDSVVNNYWGVQFVDSDLNGLLIRNNTIVNIRKNISSITIPADITDIFVQAFDDAPLFESIRVDAMNSIYDSREDCNAIIETATNSMLFIGSKSSFIPQTIRSVQNCAYTKVFKSQVRTIKYNGTMADWDKIEALSVFCSRFTILCSDGSIRQ